MLELVIHSIILLDKVGPFLFKLLSVVFAAFSTTSLPSLKQTVQELLKHIGVHNIIAVWAVSIIIFVLSTLVIFSLSVVGFAEFYESHLRNDEKCDNASYYKRSVGGGMQSLMVFIKECPNSKNVSEAKTKYFDLRFKETVSCINDNKSKCESLACVVPFDDEFGEVAAFQLKTTAENNDYSEKCHKETSGSRSPSEDTPITADKDKDEKAWTAAKQANTIKAYESYRSAFPSGAHALDATNLIDHSWLQKILQNAGIKFSYTYRHCAFNVSGSKLEYNNGGASGEKVERRGTLRTDNNKVTLIHDLDAGGNVNRYETIAAEIGENDTYGKTLYKVGEQINGREMLKNIYVPYTSSASINEEELTFAYHWDYRGMWPAGHEAIMRRKNVIRVSVTSEKECSVVDGTFYDYGENLNVDNAYNEFSCGPELIKMTCEMTKRTK